MKMYFAVLLFLFSQALRAQGLPCYALKYFDDNATQVVYSKMVPTQWWAILMTTPCKARIDSAYFMFGIQRVLPSGRPDTLQVRILAATLPAVNVLDSISLRIPPNMQGQFPASYYIAEMNLDGTLATVDSGKNFYLSWRIRGATNDQALIYFRQPAINPLRSVVINTNGSVVPVSQIIRAQIPDSADLYAESHVCCFFNPPIELSSFNAVYHDGAAYLDWKTATEENNYGFEIERLVAQTSKMNLQIWEKIGFYPGHGTTTSEQSYTYRDDDAAVYADEGGFVRYRLVQIDFNGHRTTYQTQKVLIPRLQQFAALQQNYPNPVSRSTNTTSISYSLSREAHVMLEVFDALGRTVATLVDDTRSAGEHTVPFHTASLPGGMYFYTLRSGSAFLTKVLTVLE
jgi:hypothetical protein